MIAGRARTCWLVRDEAGRCCVIKDLWVLDLRPQTEINFLNTVREKKVKGICHMLESEDLTVDGRTDSTDANQGFMSDLEHWIHHQILFGDVLIPLTKFKST